MGCSFRSIVPLLVSVTFAGTVDVCAQAPSQRPPRALFGGGNAKPDATRQLDLRLELQSASDHDVGSFASGEASDNPDELRARPYSALSAALAMNLSGKRLALRTNANSIVRHQQDFVDLPVDHRGNMELEIKMGRANIRLTQTGAITPFYSLNLFPALPEPTMNDLALTGSDYTIAKRQSVTYESRGEASWQMARHSTLSFAYDQRQTTFTGERSDQRTRNGSGRFSQQFTRHLAIRLGYGIQESEYQRTSVGTPPRLYNLDLGVDYNKALSISRKTKLSFTTGSVASGTEGTASPDLAPQRRSLRFNLVGGATLAHEIGRTWGFKSSYRRNVDAVPGILAPVFLDSVTTGLNGSVSRRLEFDAAAAYSRGRVGFGADANGYAAYTGTARVRLGLSRAIAVHALYLYHQFKFDGSVPLMPGLSSRLNRHGLRAGVTYWIPVLQ